MLPVATRSESRLREAHSLARLSHEFDAPLMPFMEASPFTAPFTEEAPFGESEFMLAH